MDKRECISVPRSLLNTEGKAGGQARRYKEAAEKALGKMMRVNIYPVNAPKAGQEATKPFRWRIYIPLAQQS